MLEMAEIVATANSHYYSRTFEKFPETDGLYLQPNLAEMIALTNRGTYIQCTCVCPSTVGADIMSAWENGVATEKDTFNP